MGSSQKTMLGLFEKSQWTEASNRILELISVKKLSHFEVRDLIGSYIEN